MNVKAEDIEVISNEMDITPEEAELVLRENNGDLRGALRSFIAA